MNSEVKYFILAFQKHRKGIQDHRLQRLEYCYKTVTHRSIWEVQGNKSEEEPGLRKSRKKDEGIFWKRDKFLAEIWRMNRSWSIIEERNILLGREEKNKYLVGKMYIIWVMNTIKTQTLLLCNISVKQNCTCAL